MPTEMHDPDDSCAPFPHRVFISPRAETTVGKGPRAVIVVREEYRAIMCAHCDHLISRTIPGCQCPFECHQIASLLASLDGG